MGGMVHYAYRMCDAMAEAGADVTLITSTEYELAGLPHRFRLEPILRPTSRPAGPAVAGAGAVAAVRRRVRRAVRLASALRLVLTEWVRLARRLLELRPDIVQFGSIEHAVEGPFLHVLRARGLVLAGVVHEPEVRSKKGLRWTLDVRLYRWIYPAFRHVFVHGEANRRRFLELYPGVPPPRVRSIRMGSLTVPGADGDRPVDLRARHGLPDDAPVVAFFGTLLPSKGVDDLLDAWVTVRQRRPDARLLVAGNPSRHIPDGYYEDRAASLGLADAVTIAPGYVPNDEIGSLMRLASVVAFPYRSATQSGALQVAYAHGRPVVVTRAGALGEVVEDGDSGLVVEPRDTAGLADAIVALLDDPERAERMGARALELSRTEHSWAAIARSVLAVYEGSPAG